MLLNSIKIGDKVEINSKDKFYSDEYFSKVEHILDKQRIVFHMPISKGQLVKLPVKKEYNLLFFTDRGMVRFDSKIISHSTEDGFSLTTAELLGKGEKIQRRDYFRFTCNISTKISLLADGDFDDNHMKKRSFDGIIKDIGGGGIRFNTDNLFEDQDKFKIVIALGDEVIVAKARILHKSNVVSGSYKYQYGAEFIEMQKGEREVIIQYIFDQQRKILQRVK